MAETGEYPNEITRGILCALQKPGKPKGPPQNLRPIILLSTFRKILAVYLMERIGEKIDSEIPPSQAAYRKGRSTTEHVFAVKQIIDRTITSKAESAYLALHDMSKAFDSINRNILINDLTSVIDKDELHLVKKLMEVELAANSGNHLSEYFTTDTGVPQRDCMSANEFTFYLAKTINKRIHIDHNYFKNVNSSEIPKPMQEHCYCQIPLKQHLTLNLEYADDITEITTNPERVKKTKESLPKTLLDRLLTLSMLGGGTLCSPVGFLGITSFS